VSRHDWAAAPLPALRFPISRTRSFRTDGLDRATPPWAGPREGSDAPGFLIAGHRGVERERAGTPFPALFFSDLLRSMPVSISDYRRPSSPTPSTRGAAAAPSPAPAQSGGGRAVAPAEAGYKACSSSAASPPAKLRSASSCPLRVTRFVFPLSSEATGKLLFLGRILVLRFLGSVTERCCDRWPWSMPNLCDSARI